MKKLMVGGGIAAALGLVAVLAYADVVGTGSGVAPRLLPYTGNLDHDGSPVTGKVALKVCLVNRADTDCSDKTWTEEFDSVDVAGGNFSLVLGNTTPIPDDIYSAPSGLFIRTMVGASVASGTPTFVQLSGAQRVLSVPFAINANQATDLHLDGAVHNGATVPTGNAFGLFNETPGGRTRINASNGGVITFNVDADRDGNGYVPATQPIMTVKGDGVQFGNSVSIRQVTYCRHRGSELAGPSKAWGWSGSDCNNGLPSGTCVGALTIANSCGSATQWAAFSPLQDSRVNDHGGVVWYDECGKFAFDVAALYFCAN